MDKALIERLALEAGLTDAHLSPWMTDYGYSEDEICKFVSLIANECAKYAEEMGIAALNGKSQVLIVSAMAKAIRDRFGFDCLTTRGKHDA